MRKVFHKINLKPESRSGSASQPSRGRAAAALVFGLPGNPVSGLVVSCCSSGRHSRHSPAVPRWLAPREGQARGTASPNAVTARPISLPGSSAANVKKRPRRLPSIVTLDWAGSADLTNYARRSRRIRRLSRRRPRISSGRNCRLSANALNNAGSPHSRGVTFMRLAPAPSRKRFPPAWRPRGIDSRGILWSPASLPVVLLWTSFPPLEWHAVAWVALAPLFWIVTCGEAGLQGVPRRLAGWAHLLAAGPPVAQPARCRRH